MSKYFLFIAMALTINAYSKEFNPTMQDIHVITPAPAASGLSSVFRMLEEYGLKRNIRFVLDYRPGADSIIALNYAYSLPANGNTIVLAPISDLTRNLPHQNFQTRNFTPIAALCHATIYVVSSQNVPANNITELITLIKSDPQKYTWALTQKSFELVMSNMANYAGLSFNDLITVRYNGKGNLAVTNIAGNQVDLGFVTAAQSLALINSKKLKLLGTWKPKDYTPFPVENLETVMGGDTGSMDALGVFMTSANSAESQAYWKRFINEFTADPEIRQKLQDNFYRHPDAPIGTIYNYNLKLNAQSNVSFKMPGPNIELTRRQEQIYGLIKLRGMSNRDIAYTLDIGESAVKMHVTALLKKFNVERRSQLQAFG
jgi:tripartite-type tricarboxylate transporter receptor subunit TctC/DNA-binding CsgD family transcriptional regulator